MIEYLNYLGSDLVMPLSAMTGPFDWFMFKYSLDRIRELTTYYQLKEAAALFELALWKGKLEEEDNIGGPEREMYRIEVPGPVKDAVLQYLPSYIRPWEGSMIDMYVNTGSVDRSLAG